MSKFCCDYGCNQGRNCPARITPIIAGQGGNTIADGKAELPISLEPDTFFDTIDLLIVSARYIVLGIAALVAGLAVYSLFSA